MQASELTSYLHAHIPLTRAMQIAARDISADEVILAAPLGPNTNHTDTAFGGSLSTLGIVAGWSLVHATLAERGVSARLLIQKSATEFLRPADGDLEASCRFPDPDAAAAFLDALQQRRRARIELEASVCSRRGKALTPVATHRGVYVAILY